MGECAHLLKAEQPRNLGYMQLAVIKVTNRQVTSQVLMYFSELQPSSSYSIPVGPKAAAALKAFRAQCPRVKAKPG